MTLQIETRAAPRSALKQERSRQRQKSLLDAAETIIAEVGLADMAMREVARRAQVPIASVYHYYPAAPALVRALAERQLDRLGSFIAARLVIHGVSEPGLAVDALARRIVGDVAGELATMPAAPAIWNALRSDPALRELDRADTLALARRLRPLIDRARPASSSQANEAYALVLLETVAINLMFAMESPPADRPELIDALQELVGRALSAR